MINPFKRVADLKAANRLEARKIVAEAKQVYEATLVKAWFLSHGADVKVEIVTIDALKPYQTYLIDDSIFCGLKPHNTHILQQHFPTTKPGVFEIDEENYAQSIADIGCWELCQFERTTNGIVLAPGED